MILRCDPSLLPSRPPPPSLPQCWAGLSKFLKMSGMAKTLLVWMKAMCSSTFVLYSINWPPALWKTVQRQQLHNQLLLFRYTQPLSSCAPHTMFDL